MRFVVAWPVTTSDSSLEDSSSRGHGCSAARNQRRSGAKRGAERTGPDQLHQSSWTPNRPVQVQTKKYWEQRTTTLLVTSTESAATRTRCCCCPTSAMPIRTSYAPATLCSSYLIPTHREITTTRSAATRRSSALGRRAFCFRRRAPAPRLLLSPPPPPVHLPSFRPFHVS